MEYMNDLHRLECLRNRVHRTLRLKILVNHASTVTYVLRMTLPSLYLRH